MLEKVYPAGNPEICLDEEMIYNITLQSFVKQPWQCREIS